MQPITARSQLALLMDQPVALPEGAAAIADTGALEASAAPDAYAGLAARIRCSIPAGVDSSRTESNPISVTVGGGGHADYATRPAGPTAGGTRALICDRSLCDRRRRTSSRLGRRNSHLRTNDQAPDSRNRADQANPSRFPRHGPMPPSVTTVVQA